MKPVEHAESKASNVESYLATREQPTEQHGKYYETELIVFEKKRMNIMTVYGNRQVNCRKMVTN